MENTITVKRLALIPRLFLGAITGICAGGFSGAVGGGFLLAALNILTALSSKNGLDSLLMDVIGSSVLTCMAGAFIGGLAAAPMGTLFGLVDGLWYGRLSMSLNGKLVWAFVGALLGPIGGAI